MATAAGLCALNQGLGPTGACILHLGRCADACALLFSKGPEGRLSCRMGWGAKVEGPHKRC